MASVARKISPVVAVIALSLALAGCAAGHGPLQTTGLADFDDPESGPGGATICSALAPGARGVTVSEDITNTSDLPLAITEVTLVGNDGIELIEAFSIPGNNGRVGSDRYPMTFVSAETWEARTPALGLIVQPDEEAHILLGLTLEDGVEYGQIDHIEISYSYSGAEYSAPGGITFVVAQPNCDVVPD